MRRAERTPQRGAPTKAATTAIRCVLAAIQLFLLDLYEGRRDVVGNRWAAAHAGNGERVSTPCRAPGDRYSQRGARACRVRTEAAGSSGRKSCDRKAYG